MSKKIITHMVCWYPNLEESKKLFDVLSKYSEFVEIQFPFSDPVADGPLISEANEKAIENWITTKDCFEFINNIEKEQSKIIIMSYFNIVYNYNPEKFVKKSKQLWVYGLIIPDIPFDTKEWKYLIKLCKKNNIKLIQIVSPDTKEERLTKTSQISSGFVYAISESMTTWSNIKFEDDFKNYITKLKKYFKIPIWVWFWVKTKEDINKILEIANMAIIWSKILDIYKNKWINKVENFLKNLK